MTPARSATPLTGVVLFEDSRWRDLRPLTDLTAVPALAFGAATLGERWQAALGLPLRAVVARPGLLPKDPGAAAIDPAEELLVVNAAALPGPWIDAVRAAAAPAVFGTGGVVMAARVDAATVAPALAGAQPFEDILAALVPSTPVDARRIARPWDVIAGNPAAIAADLAGLTAAREGEVHPLAVLLEPDRIAIGPGARIEPLAVLDARDGPIRIGPRALVRSGTVVSGPCSVGAGTQLLGGFVSRSTFGPDCRIAGEVEDCVWQGYGNKRHHGFVGHSVIGEWVNLGALTTTSDLKNNYGNVRVWVDGLEVDSGSPKVGALIGAHVKTGIGTLLPTGASVGIGANLFGGGRFAPKALPAFAWWDGDQVVDHQLEPFLRTARIAMSRRGRELGAPDERLLRDAFQATTAERETAREGRDTATGRA